MEQRALTDTQGLGPGTRSIWCWDLVEIVSRRKSVVLNQAGDDPGPVSKGGERLAELTAVQVWVEECLALPLLVWRCNEASSELCLGSS